MHRYRDLMVGLTRTNTDEGLIRYVSMVARLGAAKKIRFVHVLPDSAEISPEQDHDSIRAELLAKVQPHFQDMSGAVEVSCDLLHGPLLDQLLAYAAAQQVDLLLVGSGTRRTLARRLAMKVPCSIWMVPEAASGTLRRILIPIDFSEEAADALRVAASLARHSGHAGCMALHVYFNEAVITYEGYDRVVRGQEQKAYRQFLAPIDCQGVKINPLFEEGANVAHVIARAVERHNVDLVVMATRGRSRSAAILLGSVTEEMIRAAGVPLLAVKHFGARLGVLQALLDRRFHQRGDLHTD